MSDSQAARRFLIATAVCRYTNKSDLDIPELQDDLNRVIDLFTNTFGYQRVVSLGLNPGKEALKRKLRAFCTDTDRRPEDYLVVYFAGHGEVLEASQDYVLLPADTDPDDLAYTGLRAGDLVDTLLDGTPVRRLLLLLDTCFSGDGGAQAAARALNLERQRRDRVAEPGFVVVTASRPAQFAAVGAFTTGLVRAVESLATGAYAPDTLEIGAVVGVMNDNNDTQIAQQVTWMPVGLMGQPPAFLPNPRRNPALSNVDLLIQVRAEEAARRDVEYERRFLVRAKAGFGQDDSWWFEGRHAALTRITAWLSTVTAEQSALVVTGAPGSGKTAVLGLASTLANPERRPTVPVHQMGLPQAALPKPGSIDATIYAGNLTSGEVLRGLAAAAGVEAATVGTLISRLGSRQHPLTFLVDALDEAADPDELVSQVLQPLIDEPGQVRLLLGTRPHLLPLLRARIEKLDLDEKAYADPDSLRSYARRCLVEAAPESPYRAAPSYIVQAVAGAVAEAAGHSFLIARITSRTLGEGDSIPNPDNAAWRAGLPRLPGLAIRADFDQRLGADAARAMDLLLPLAYAEGQGLPWENIWPVLASRISGRTYGEGDLMWLRRRVGSYIVEAPEGQYSAYRLYHQALADYIRAGSDPVAVHSVFVDILTSTAVSTVDARPVWARAHPYAKAYLATHAVAAGRLDALLLDPGFLLVAERGRLLESLPAAQSLPAIRAASAYRGALNPMASSVLRERPAYLQLAALRDGATELAAALTDTTPAAKWQARWAVWDPTDPNEVITGHVEEISAIAVTNVDGRLIAVTACQIYDELRLADLQTFAPDGDPIETGHQASIDTVAVVQLHARPTIVSIGGDVRLTDMETRTPVGDPIPIDEICARTVVQLGGRPTIVMGGSQDDKVRLRDLASHKLVSDPIPTGHPGGVSAVALTQVSGNPIVLTGGRRDADDNDDTVRLWDLRARAPAGDPIRTGLSGQIKAIAVTEVDGRPTAIVGGDRELRLVDLSTRTPVGDRIQPDHYGFIGAIAVTQIDGRPTAITTCTDDSMVRLWDLHHWAAMGDPIWTGPFVVRAIAVTQIDARPAVIVGAADGSVRVVDLQARPPSGEGQHTPRIGGISQVSVVQLGNRPVVVTTSPDNTAVRLWDARTGEPAGEPIRTSHQGGIGPMAIAQLDGRPAIITGGRGTNRYRSPGDSTVQVWDLHARALAGEPIRTDDKGGIGAVAVAELGRKQTVVIGSGYAYGGSGTIQVWDLHTGAQIRRPIRPYHAAGIDPVVVNQLNGHPVVIIKSNRYGSIRPWDTTVQVWDLDTGTAVGDPRISSHGGSGGALKVTQVGGHPVVLAAGRDGILQLWELGSIWLPRSRLLRKAMHFFKSEHAFDNSMTAIILVLVCALGLIHFSGKWYITRVLIEGNADWLSAVIYAAWALVIILVLAKILKRKFLRQYMVVEPADTYSTDSRVTALCCRSGPGVQEVYVGYGHTVELLRIKLRADGKTNGICLEPLEISVDVGAAITSLEAVEPTSLLVGTIKGMVLLDFSDVTYHPSSLEYY